MSTLEDFVGELAAKVAVLEARIVSLEKGSTAAATLPDVDIDDPKYGDPLVRKDPPKWKGESFSGQPYSLCTPEYLRSLAGFKQWCAAKERAEGKEKYAGYSMRDAAKALAWAKRIEENRGRAANAQPAPEPEDDRWSATDDTDIPF